MSGAHRQSPDTFRQDAAILGHWGSGQPRGRAAFPDDGEPRGRVKADDSLSAFNDCYLEGVGGASRFSRPAPDSEAVERRGASSTRHPTVARCARKTFRGGQKNAACLSLACDVGYSRFFLEFFGADGAAQLVGGAKDAGVSRRRRAVEATRDATDLTIFFRRWTSIAKWLDRLRR